MIEYKLLQELYHYKRTKQRHLLPVFGSHVKTASGTNFPCLDCVREFTSMTRVLLITVHIMLSGLGPAFLLLLLSIYL